MARRVRIKAGKVDGGAEKPGAGVEDGSEETAAASFQEGDRGAETYSGLKCEESSPSPPPSETAGSAWGNRAPTQKRDLKSEGLESEADPGIFSSHLLACVSNLSRSLLQVTSALTEASSHQAQDPAALSEQAQFQAMVSSWMFLCNTCFSLPMIMALFSKPKTPLFAPPSNPDRVDQWAEALLLVQQGNR
ncbi:heat shock transcription factor, X-linked-like [Arapaima gigas]